MRALVFVAAVVCACVVSTSAPTTPSPSSTETSAPATPSQTTAPATTPPLSPAAASPTATTVAGGRYASAELGYSLDLPAGWRKAVCSAGIIDASPMRAVEFFVDVPEAEEHVGPGTRLVGVRVNQSQGLAATTYLERDASQPDVRVEPVTLNGRTGARAFIATTGVTYAFAVAARGWMYEVERPYFGSEDEQLLRIMSTLRILDDATGRPAAASSAPRTVEALADAIADAFARRDLSAIAETMEPCVTVGAVPGDGSTQSRAAYLKHLASQFAAGTSIQVRARPIDDDPAFGRVVRSTWSRSGQADQRVDFVLRARGERWSISSILYRAF